MHHVVKTVQAFPPLFVLQVTKAGRGGLGRRLDFCSIVKFHDHLHQLFIITAASNTIRVLLNVKRDYCIHNQTVDSVRYYGTAVWLQSQLSLNIASYDCVLFWL